MPTASRTVSAQESLVMVRNTMRTCVSTIAYLRAIFPDDCFADRTLSGVQLKSLQANTPDSRMVVEWLERGVFDALERQFLRVLSFVVLTPDEQTVVESYDFRVAYPAGGAEVSLGGRDRQVPVPQDKDQVAHATRALLRKLVTLTHGMHDLPEERVVTMRLVLDKATPADYEPAFFRDASEAVRRQFLRPGPGQVDLRLGAIATRFHLLNLRCSALESSLDPAPAPQENGGLPPPPPHLGKGEDVKPEVEADEELGCALRDIEGASESSRYALLAVLHALANGGETTLGELRDWLGVSDAAAARVGAKLAAWGLLGPTACGSAQDVLDVDVQDSRVAAAAAGALRSSLRRRLSSSEVQRVEELVDRRRPRDDEEAAAAAEDNRNTQSTFYGDEPIIKQVCQPVKHFRMR